MFHRYTTVGKGNPLQHTSTGSKWKQEDATSQMMLSLLGCLSKDWKMPIVWQHASMKKDLKSSLMPSQKWRSLMPHSSSQQWSSTFHGQCNVKWRRFAVSSVRIQRHITWSCLHIRCYECNKYGHIVMDCPHIIPPSGNPVTCHKPHRKLPCQIEFKAPPWQ